MENTVVLLLTGVCLLLIGVLLYVFLQIRKELNETKQLLSSVKGEVVPLIREMRQVAQGANSVVSQARNSFGHVEPLFRSAGRFGTSLEHLAEEVRTKGVPILSRLLIIGTGIKVATSIFQQHSQNGRNSDVRNGREGRSF